MTQDNTPNEMSEGLEHLQPETIERLKSMLDNLIEDSNRHDAEMAKEKDILAMIRERKTEERNENLRHTCETIIRRQEEVSSSLENVEGGANLTPNEWEVLFDTVAEMDLLMRRLQRQIGYPQ